MKDEIIRKAKQVRDAQKEYFKTRSKEALKRNKALEQQLDTMLSRYSAGECNPTLF